MQEPVIQVSCYMRTREVCQFLNISRSTLYKYCQQGIIPKPQKMGNIPIWDRENLIAWQKQQMKKAPA
ncbi:helix-turn-helix transcriptional regulator [Histophilus somni]|uniref:helix-turn-helix transcriptional regulator n=2 Tax=Histophilus somni TaxID=731 RepID=UPI003D300774